MKLIPYEKALKMGKEKINEALAPIRANRAKKKAELEVANLDEKIAVKEAAIQEACSEQDINFKKIINLQNEHALLERERKQFQKIITEMFPGK